MSNPFVVRFHGREFGNKKLRNGSRLTAFEHGLMFLVLFHDLF